jgi:hypothetical protein
MENNDQITALAREYAEEEAKGTAVDALPNGLKENVIQRNADHFEKHLRWLLRRYRLVEKEAVRKEYESVKDTPEECNYEELGATWDEWPYLSRFYDEGYKLGQKDAIESLFPDLGKEVEE